MKTILITGGTGMIGTVLSKRLLEKGYGVIVLTRWPPYQQPGVRYASWDIEKQEMDADAIRDADVIVHLAGANVGEKRWTKRRKREIVDSRVLSGALLVKSIRSIPNRISAVISASAIGWYGADPEIPNPRPFVEEDPADGHFLGQTCLQWENAIAPVTELGKRLVIFRTGLVLSEKGGVLDPFRKALRWGVAPLLGSGRQVESWIHIEDLVRMYMMAIETESWKGIYNAVAPKPVPMRELTLEFAKREKGRFFIPFHVPGFALRLALGEMRIEVLKSATISSDKVRSAGFTFQYPSLEAALNEV